MAIDFFDWLSVCTSIGNLVSCEEVFLTIQKPVLSCDVPFAARVTSSESTEDKGSGWIRSATLHRRHLVTLIGNT